MSRGKAAVRALLLAMLLAGSACKEDPPAPPPPVPALGAVGPRLIANDSAYPLYLYGDGFVDGMQLEVRGAKFDVRRISAKLAATRVDGIDLPAGESLVTVDATLHAEGKARGQAPLIIANDAAYPWPYDLCVVGGAVFVASPTTDTIWRYAPDAAPSKLDGVRVDRPRALAAYGDFLLVLGELDGTLTLVDTTSSEVVARIEIGGHPQQLAVDGDRAYVTDRVTDRVHVVDLATRQVMTSWYAGENPRAVAVGGGKIAVSNLGGDELALLDHESGTRTAVVVGPGAKIVGGHTEPFADSIMGLKAPRDLVWSTKHDVFLAATLGPNIGPNADRMEISMNSGISVIEPGGTFRHHVSMRRGNAERIAIDDAAGILLAADISRGRVVAFDLDAVVAGTSAVRAQLFVEPPEGTVLLRPAHHYGEKNRATTSMYSGPAAIELYDGFAYVLNRFTGTVSQVDYADALDGELRLAATWPGPDLGPQKTRRAGEVVYTTDFGDSRMSCDTCHYEGHNQGTLFTKGRPIHIYRATSLRSISETAPYFTPARFPTLERISQVVTTRNRHNNLAPNTAEVTALSLFQRTLAPPPNPFADQSPVELPDGERGRPEVGAELFAANCATCHPPPMFTPDQDKATRGKMFDTGEVTIPLRPEQQDDTPYPVPVPTLVGVWDNHPLFHGGQVGNQLVDGRLVPTPFALREVLNRANHFDTTELDEQAHNDLLAYLLTL